MENIKEAIALCLEVRAERVCRLPSKLPMLKSRYKPQISYEIT